ncbi:hypothetical protein [Ferrimonas pelagia]|uniref:Curli production assembly/transport component CsgG n=1 Tax=Ferrimonas pelagia TaxID=1177826 RepID=A0ABP9FCK6_9GAMM
MKKRISLSTAALTIAMVSGCVSTGPSNTKISSLPDIQMQDVENMPSKLFSNEQYTVIVMPTVVGASGVNKDVVQRQFQISLDNILAEAGIQTIDRDMHEQLIDELQLAESAGRLNFEGPMIADFAIYSNVSTATIRPKYLDGLSPPNCAYYGDIQGQVRIVELPSMRHIATTAMHGTQTETRPTFDPACPMTHTLVESMMNNSSNDALQSAKTELRNHMTPKGHVIARRGNDSLNVFKVSLGIARGAKPGEKVEIFRNRINQYDTGEVESEIIVVAEGKFTESIDGRSSWIELTNSNKADLILRGDMVRIVHEDSLLESADKSWKNLKKTLSF